MKEAGSLDLTPVRSGGSVRDQVDSELSLGGLDSCVGGSCRDLGGKTTLSANAPGQSKTGYRESLGEEFKMMDQSLHGGLHLCSVGRDTLGIISPHVSLRHLEGDQRGENNILLREGLSSPG